MIERQARLAASAGANPVLIFVERLPAALSAAVERLERVAANMGARREEPLVLFVAKRRGALERVEYERQALVDERHARGVAGLAEGANGREEAHASRSFSHVRTIVRRPGTLRTPVTATAEASPFEAIHTGVSSAVRYVPPL